MSLPQSRREVHGERQRGEPSEPAYSSVTGQGYVREVDGQYKRARGHGVDLRCLHFETFGGFGPESVAFVEELSHAVSNKLRKHEFDETTWAARTWCTFTTQKLSVALHRAVAGEIASALGLSQAVDRREVF